MTERPKPNPFKDSSVLDDIDELLNDKSNTVPVDNPSVRTHGAQTPSSESSPTRRKGLFGATALGIEEFQFPPSTLLSDIDTLLNDEPVKPLLHNPSARTRSIIGNIDKLVEHGEDEPKPPKQ